MTAHVADRTDIGLKGLVDLTNEILTMHKDVGNTDELQTKVQEFFCRTVTDIDAAGIEDIKSDQFAGAMEVLREYVFIRPDGTDVPNYAAAKLAEASAIAESLKWPPIFPQVAVVINLIRAMIQAGVKVNTSYDVPADFDFSPFMHLLKRNHCRNGWTVFYMIYRDLVLFS